MARLKQRPAPELNRSAKRLTDTQRGELARFAADLTEHMTAHHVSVGKLAKYTGLRPETVRSYMAGKNRPTKMSLRRLSMIFGTQIAKHFAGTELAGPDEEAIEPIYLHNGWVILRTYVLMPESVLGETLALWRPNKVGEIAPPVYGSIGTERKR